MFKTTIMVNKREKHLLYNFYFRQTATLFLYFFKFKPFLLLFSSFFPNFFVLILSYLSGRCTFFFADISGRNFLSSFGHFWAELFPRWGGGGGGCKCIQCTPHCVRAWHQFSLIQCHSSHSNARNSLVLSSLPSNLEPGTFNCSRKVRNTCPFINFKTRIQGPVPSKWPFRLHNLQYHLLYHLYSLQQTLHWKIRP